MNIKFEWDDKGIKKYFKDLEKAIEGQYSFDELFNRGFMRKNTKYSSIDEMFDEYNIDINSQEDFEKLDEAILDKAISSSTKYRSWQELLQAAGQEATDKKLKKKGFK